MAGEVAGQANELEESVDESPSPSTSSPDLESIRAELQLSLRADMEAQFQERAAGFQRALAEKDAELRALKTAGLSEDEREQLARQENESAIEVLRRENELLKLAREFPDEMPLFERVLNAPTAKAQLEAFRVLRAELSPKAPAPVAEPELEVPDILSSNPPRQTGPTLPDGTAMSDALADRLLGSASGGALRR
jgi:hypothetical protein